MPRGVTQSQSVKDHLARNLHQAMVEKGIPSQSELGRLTGIARHNISLYMSAKSAPTSINLAKLARVLEVEPRALLGAEAPGKEGIQGSSKTEARLSSEGIYLKIDRSVSWDVGMKILHLLDEDRKYAPDLAD